jgi:asparagine synthase (glutamine-hydrolysing)
MPWFVVLPDVLQALPVAERLRRTTANVQEIRHPSGRPFVLGRWAPSGAVVADGRDTRMVAFGEPGGELAHDLQRAAERETVCALDGLRPSGSVHLIASAHGRVRVQGTASGLRRVFHTSAEPGVAVASDRGDVLASLTGAEPDRCGLALRLLSPNAPWPLSWHSAWRKVTAVLPGHFVLLVPDGPQTARWWTAPEPVLPLEEAGTALRDALAEAVCIRRSGTVACDVSGLDSGSLFALAMRAGGPVVALTYEADDPLDEDVAAARSLVASLRTATTRHDVLPAAHAPLPFEGLLNGAGVFDEPTWVSTYRARMQTASNRAAKGGARLRFAGHGGDELLMPPPSWLSDIARRHPVRAARLARQLQAKYRFRASALAGTLAVGTYGEWLAGCLQHETPDGPSDATLGQWQSLGWGVPPQLAPWATADTSKAVRAAVGAAAGEPLSRLRGMHTTLELVHTGALAARHIAQLGASDGMPVALPYLDDRVVEACLSVRPDEAIDPRRYKPLLGAAMAGILPAPALARTSKSEISMTVGIGWRTHRAELLDLLDDSRLAELGLIDAAAVRRICQGPYTPDTCLPVRQVLEIETWLQTLT